MSFGFQCKMWSQIGWPTSALNCLRNIYFQNNLKKKSTFFENSKVYGFLKMDKNKCPNFKNQKTFQFRKTRIFSTYEGKNFCLYF